MGFFSKLAGLLSKPEQRTIDSPRKAGFSEFMGMGESGIAVNEESALHLSATWACIRLLSELPASLPVEVMKEEGDHRSPIDHWVKDLLMNPTQLMNRFSFHETMNGWLQGWGNGYALLDIGKFNPGVSLIPLHPKGVEPVISQGKIFYKVKDELTGITGTFFRDEIIHYKMFSTDGIKGKSPIMVAKDNIALGLAAERYGSTFFRKGGNIKAVIETTGHMGDEEFKTWKRRWDTYYKGSNGDHETPILEYGMNYKPLGIEPDAAQFIESRQFQLTEICRVFNVPPHLIGDLSRATFSNIEHQDLQFVKYTLRPILRRQEMELEEKLLDVKERGKIRIRFNIDGLLRGDLAATTNHILQLTNNGTLTRNEGRALLNRNPLDGLDKPLDPANITGKKAKEAQKYLKSLIMHGNGKE